MKLDSVEAVLLDAGNTILGIDYVSLAGLLAHTGRAVDPARLHRAEAAARVALDPLLARGASTEGRDTFGTYLDLVLDGVGFPQGSTRAALRERVLTPEELDRIWSEPLPGAREAMERLRGAGLRLAVVSNADGRAAQRLERAGCLAGVEYVVDSALVGCEKPDPAIFHHALHRLGVAPHRAVHVGDYYSVDVLGARAAGLTGILLDPFGLWGDLDCPRFRDLTHFAEALVGGG